MMHDCGCENNWVYAIFGILFLIAGYLLWAGSWSLEQAIGVVIILIGLKKLAVSCHPTMPAKRRKK